MSEEQRQLAPAHSDLNLTALPVNARVAPQAIDKDLAAISAAVYDPSRVMVGNWKRLVLAPVEN